MPRHCVPSATVGRERRPHAEGGARRYVRTHFATLRGRGGRETPGRGVGEQRLQRGMVQRVTAATRAEGAADRRAGEREIAHRVQHLVADEFVAEAQALGIENAVGRDGDGIFERGAEREARPPQPLDIADEAVMHAGQRYRRDNLSFRQGDCTDPSGLPDGPFDLIVSFETLEHVHEQSRMLAAFAERLSDDGILLVSSPDKLNYSDRRNYQNEFHVRELYRDELETLLAGHFPATRLYAQKLAFQSLLWSLDGRVDRYDAAVLAEDGESLATTLDYPPMYYVAACARKASALDALPALSLFGDLEESVYRHYEHEIRKNMSAGARIQELEQALADAQRRIAELAPGQGD